MPSQQPFQPGSKVVAYVRYSGGVEQGLKDRSTKEQTHDIQQFCDKNSLILYRVYEDAGISGTSLKGRDAFFEMINFLKSRPKPDVAGVVVWSLSRFARDLNTAQLYKADLRRLGYTIFSLTEQFEDSATGILFETLIDWKNQMYSEEIAAHVSRSLRTNFEQFKVLPGRPPRGLMRIPVNLPSKKDGTPRVGHRWEVDPLLAPAIRRAFELKAGGASNYQIMKELPFYKNDSSLRDVFRRSIFYGSMTYSGVTLEDYCQPIITKDLWQQVQEVCMKEVRAKKREGKFSDQNTRLLSGLLVCPICSRKMYVCRRTSNGTEYSSYRCSNCSGQTIPCWRIEEAVIHKAIDEILVKGNIDNMVELYRAEYGMDDHSKQKSEKDDYTAQLIAVAARIERVTDAISEIGLSSSLQSKLKTLQSQQQEIREKQAELQSRINEDDEIIDRAHENSTSIVDVLKDKEAPLEMKREALQLFIKEIIPSGKTSAIIRYHLPDNCASKLVPPPRRRLSAQMTLETSVSW